jgi:hypothetical protein
MAYEATKTFAIRKMKTQFTNKNTHILHTCPIQCKMSDGKIKRPLDIPFVKWIKWTSNFPLDFCVSIGSNGQMECPLASNGSIGTMHQPNKRPCEGNCRSEQCINRISASASTDLYKNTVVLLFLSTLFSPGYEAGLLYCLKLNICHDFTTYTFPLI